MWAFLEGVIALVHHFDGKNACIIAGAVFGFFIELAIVVFLEANSNRAKIKQTDR